VTPVKPAATKPATTTPTAADATADKTKPTADDEETVDTLVAQALGDAAMLLNSVELQGVRNLFRTGGSGRTGRSGSAPTVPGASPTAPGGRGGDAGTAGAAGSDATAGTVAKPAPQTPTQGRSRGDFGRGSRPPNANDPSRGTLPRQRPVPQSAEVAAPTAAAPTAVPVAPGSMPAAPASPTPPTQVLPPLTPPTTPAPPPTATEDRFVVDLGAMARDLTKRIAPDGLDKLSPEDRQRVSREIGMRMMGVAEGLRIGAAEIQKKAEAAKVAAAEHAKAAEATHTTEAPADVPSHTRSTLTGNKLGVVVERGGKVVHSANAEVNLDNLLMTVFSYASRTGRSAVRDCRTDRSTRRVRLIAKWSTHSAPPSIPRCPRAR
jgi:hypothetical protein